MDAVSDPPLAFRLVVLRFFSPLRVVDDFPAFLELRPAVFGRPGFLFVPLREDRVSIDSASPPITEPELVPGSGEKLNSIGCLRDFGAAVAFLLPRRLTGPASEIVALAAPFPDVAFLFVPDRELPEVEDLRFLRPRVAISSAAVSVAVQSFSTSCEETTR